MIQIECNKCGWVSFQVSRQFALDEVTSFNKYFATLSKKDQDDHYGGKGATIEFYERCFRCDGNYKDFKDSVKDVTGHTINPVIDRNE